MTFGLIRATVLGLMERPEQAVSDEDQLADAGDAGDHLAQAPTPPERRAGWIDRRQQPEDR